MSEARSVLLVDHAGGGLGDVALRLIRLGIDAYFAQDPEEGWLLAQQEAEQVRVVLVSPAVDPRGIERIMACLDSRAPQQPRTVVVVGERPDDATRDRLKQVGAEKALWGAYDESSLRMLVSDAMASGHRGGDTRRSPRLPTTLLARAFRGMRRKDGIVYSLSRHGAFLEMPYPFEAATPVTLEIEMPKGTLLLRGEVVTSREAGQDGKADLPAGMGVNFLDPDEKTLERLGRFLQELEGRFAL